MQHANARRGRRLASLIVAVAFSASLVPTVAPPASALPAVICNGVVVTDIGFQPPPLNYVEGVHFRRCADGTEWPMPVQISMLVSGTWTKVAVGSGTIRYHCRNSTVHDFKLTTGDRRDRTLDGVHCG